MSVAAVRHPRLLSRRILAWLVDLAVWLVPVALSFLALADRRPAVEDDERAGSFLALQFGDTEWYVEGAAANLHMVIALGAGALLAGVLPGRTGRTPGKALLGLKVVGSDGRPPGVWRGLLRWLLLPVDGLPYFVPMLVGFMTAALSQHGQRLGDMVARTTVVRAPRDSGTPAWAPPSA